MLHDNSKKKVVIISVPYCEPLPLVAPILLAACLESADIPAIGIDLNIDFLNHFSDKKYFIELKNFLTIGHLVKPQFEVQVYKDVIRWTTNYLLQIKRNHDPEYIGISIFTSESLDFGIILSYLIRRYLPEVTLIAGGKGLEINNDSGNKQYEHWIKHNVVDAIVVGDAETAIIDVVRNKKTGLVYAAKQSKEDLDNIPLAKWDDYDLNNYVKLADVLDRNNQDRLKAKEKPYLTVTGSKGCVRKCTFCDVADFWPEFIYRDPVKVAEEIIFNHRKTGIKRFLFTDNLINGSISNFRIMNEVLSREIPKAIEYGGYAIFRGKNQMPESDFELAARAGNDLWVVGVESGSEKIRFDMKKKFDNEDLDWSIRMLYKYGITQHWLLMVGYPSETEKDFQDTVDLIRRYRDFRDKIKVQVSPTFSILSNSPLLQNPDIADSYGLSHVKNPGSYDNKFWTSTKYVDNDFPTRSSRWKKLVQTFIEEGYVLGPGMPLQKWKDEIENLDRIYHEQKNKVIPIHTSK